MKQEQKLRRVIREEIKTLLTERRNMYTELADWPCRIRVSEFEDTLTLIVGDQNNTTDQSKPDYPEQGARSFIREARKELEDRTGLPWKGQTAEYDTFHFTLWEKKLIKNIKNKLHTGKS